jgi:hypothetical protein
MQVSDMSKEITEPKMGKATILFCEKFHLRLDFCSIATSMWENFPPYYENGKFSTCIAATISPTLTHRSNTSSPLMTLLNALTLALQFTW